MAVCLSVSTSKAPIKDKKCDLFICTVNQYASLRNWKKSSARRQRNAKIFTTSSYSSEKVFEKTAPFATLVLDGFNVSIYAYGQTDTGKTYTMQGTECAPGVNYRILDELF